MTLWTFLVDNTYFVQAFKGEICNMCTHMLKTCTRHDETALLCGFFMLPIILIVYWIWNECCCSGGNVYATKYITGTQEQ